MQKISLAQERTERTRTTGTLEVIYLFPVPWPRKYTSRRKGRARDREIERFLSFFFLFFKFIFTLWYSRYFSLPILPNYFSSSFFSRSTGDYSPLGRENSNETKQSGSRTQAESPGGRRTVL
jgi:hypothetical protein